MPDSQIEILDDSQSDTEIKEQFYTQDKEEKTELLFTDRKKHLNILIKLYKSIFKSAKAIWDKTQADVTNDILHSGYSLDFSNIIETSKRDILAAQNVTKIFHKQLSFIPVFLDFAYIYYVRHFDKFAPVHKLPTFLTKYKLIMAAVKAPIDDLYVYFEQCLSNKFITELRIEIPPYHMRTMLTEDKIREKIKIHVEPLFKEILRLLIKLDNSLPTIEEVNVVSKVGSLRGVHPSDTIEPISKSVSKSLDVPDELVKLFE
jgi:hypothetical protein